MAILNFEFAMTGQSHLRRCDHCQGLRAGCQLFRAHQSADPRPLLWLKGPAVVAKGADLGHGVLLRVAPLIRGRLREQQVQLGADNSSGGGHLVFAQAQVCGRAVEELALEIEVF